jgi:hypothetical protein
LTAIDESEILAALGLTKRPPDLRFLADLFDAFDRTVPFESASKILRHAEDSDLADKPRVPEIFWSEHLELGTGGTCFARVAAFAALSEGLGFHPRKIVGSIGASSSHAAVLFDLEGRTWLADVGYPLPEIRPLESGAYESALGSCVLDAGPARATLSVVSGPERGAVIEYPLAGVTDDVFRAAWTKTFTSPSYFLDKVVLRRHDAHRVLRFFRGEVEITDAYSRTVVPLLAGRAARLAEIFSIEESVVSRALTIAGDPDPTRCTARVEAYGEIPGAERVFAELSSAEGYRRFLSGLGEAEVRPEGPAGLRAVVKSAGGDTVVEEIEIARENEVLRVRRSGGLADSGFALDRGSGEPRLVRFADLPDAREEFLRTDLGRGRIAGVLAMDLLALSRQ